jgi:hypothetical protein
MTLIAAMWETDDSILIGADSLSADCSGPGNAIVTLFETPNKLRKHKLGAPLAWATSGDRALGGEFSEWLEIFPWQGLSWAAFKNRVIDRIVEMNAEQRERVRKSKCVDADRQAENNLIQALIVGHIEQRMRLLVVDQNGISQPADRQPLGFDAIGSAAVRAKIIFMTHRYLGREFDIDTLISALDLAIHNDPLCRRPLNIWRVAGDGISDLLVPDYSPAP